MPCHKSHTRGPGVDEYLADQNNPEQLLKENGAARRELGERTLLTQALDELFDCDYRSIPDDVWVIARRRYIKNRSAVARLQAVPDGFKAYRALLETLSRLFAWENTRSIPIGMWAAAYKAFKAAESTCTPTCDQPSEAHCVDHCGCYEAGYQDGLEAQREPAGRGTA